MSRRLLAGVGALVIGALVLVGLPVIMFVVSLGSMSRNEGGCSPSSPGTDIELASNQSKVSLTDDQRANAATVIAVGYQLGVPRRGIVIALAVASQESG